MTDFGALLAALGDCKVEYIVVGGAAAIAHGSARLTQHLDIVYRRTPGNLDRLVAALAAHKPYLRGAPAGLPFVWDREVLQRGLNFTLTTSLGDIDLLGEIPGGGTWEDLHGGSIELSVFGTSCLCLSLPQLIRAKMAAGRPKDLEALAELETIQEERGE
jgi:nitroreductase